MKRDNYLLIEKLRHELHQHPELSYNETWTKRHLIDFLKQNTSAEIHDCGKYFYAVRRANKEKNKKAIAFRADFDALPIEDEIDAPYKSIIPGVGHKCGHDGHAAALCGLALELEDMNLERDVYMVFQHAEETGQGACEAVDMLNQNPDIEEIYAFHNRVAQRKGSIYIANEVSNCASKGMSIFMKGVSTHASTPELGRNPVFALTKTMNGAYDFLYQETFKGLTLCTVVQLEVGKYAFGTAASEGVLRMTIRAEHEKEMDMLQQKIEEIAKKESKKDELSLKIQYEDAFPETRNNPIARDKVIAAAQKLGYPVLVGQKPERGSEDFGYFLKKVPGALFFVGSGENIKSHHTTDFDFVDEIMENSVEMFKELIIA